MIKSSLNTDNIDCLSIDDSLKKKKVYARENVARNQKHIPDDRMNKLDQSIDLRNKMIGFEAARLIRTRLKTLAQIGEDWLYLALLGTLMALISFSMDTMVAIFLSTRLRLFQDLSEDNLVIQYIGWCLTPIVLVTFSSGFVHLCSPTAIGSGIPEMKTILRGVVLNEYLTFRTLIAKIVGLTFTLGSGLPLGKEGPSVHIASIVATLLSKLIASFQGIYENESRSSEMLSAACAVGVAATFYAPIGGVLFSIEVTTVYFAVKNYWRGFFAACCGATIWRLLGFWIKNDESISALFKTNFRTDYPFDPIELLVFSFIGATCGLAGAGYIKFHREIVQFFRKHPRLSDFLQNNRFLYPILITLIITTATFPPFLGKYTASTLGTHTTIEHLFSNRTWSLGVQDISSKEILDEWTTPDTGFHLHLVLYILMLFWTSALASTIPIPSGLFIPVLKMGAAYGRLLGELMHSAYPNGIRYGGKHSQPSLIVPGSYAVVGAAAFSGAVTHTISTSVILFELTGQIVHIIPVILGVLIANAVCQSLQPSIYDSIIEIKKLPYLPPIASSNSVSHKILVRDFMNRNIAFVWKKKCTYADLKTLLASNKKLISFPLVECSQSMKLLGSVPRSDLLKLLYLHLGRERRLEEVCRKNSDSFTSSLQLMNTVSGRTAEDRTANKSKLTKKLKLSNEDMTFKDNSKDKLKNNDLDNKGDSTRLIFRTTLPSSYGSTIKEVANQELNTSILEESKGVLGKNDRDTGCKLEEHAGSSIARIVNHYDKGSSVDEDELTKSIERIQTTANDASLGSRQSPDIIVVASINLNEDGLDPSPTIKIDKIFNDADDLIGQQLNSLNRDLKREPIVPLDEFQSNSTFNFNTNNQIAQSPSLSSRPTRSILKTSSTASSLNNMYKRNISSQSFSSSFGGLQIDGSPRSDFKGTPYHIKPMSVHNNHNLSIMMGDDNGQVESNIIKPRRKVKLPRLRVVDMTPEEQEQWEKEQLSAYIDISKCQIDEAPFQLVEQTSLYRVHTLFSMLGLNHAYVTSFGRLVGVVALKDIRTAIEKMLQE